MKVLLVTYDDRVSDLGMNLFREGCNVDRVSYKRFMFDIKKNNEWDLVIAEEGDSFGETLKLLDFINSHVPHPVVVLKETSSKIDSTMYFMQGAVEVISKKFTYEEIILKLKKINGFINKDKNMHMKKERLVISNKLNTSYQQ